MDEDHFSVAYQVLMSGIEAAAPAVDGMKDELRAMFNQGCYPRDAIRAIDRWLLPGSWRWPAFEAQFPQVATATPADLLYHRLWRLASSARHDAQFARTARIAPYKMFSPVMDDRTPPECRALNGTVGRHDDEFWLGRKIPCDRLDCRCTWIALSARDAERLSGRP